MLRRMVGTELPCELLLVGGLPLFCCPPPLGTDVAVGGRLVCRFLVGLSLMRVTMHCLQLVRFVGEAASTAPAGTKRAGAADTDLAPETSGEHMARALKVMSAKSAKRLGR